MLNWQIPYLTAALPGVGGVIRVEIEDFVVEEVPAYEPCGEGEHTFFGVEKRDISTMMLIREIAQALGVSEREISSAGLKDTRAIARQTLCVQWVPPEKIMALDVPKARVLWAKRHTNKLRSGHLRGNRFTLRIRDVVPDAAIAGGGYCGARCWREACPTGTDGSASAIAGTTTRWDCCCCATIVRDCESTGCITSRARCGSFSSVRCSRRCSTRCLRNVSGWDDG